MKPLIALVASLFLGCGGPDTVLFGNGVLAIVERAVPGTTSVTVANWGDLTIRIGSPASLSITGEENLLSHLSSDVTAGKLWLGTEPFLNVRPTRALTYVLTVPSLTGIAVSSSGSVTAPALTASDFTVDVSSSGGLTIEGLEANRLTTRISSAGDVHLTGAVRDLTVFVSSSGDLLADGLRSTNATVTLSSSGNALLWVTERLDATLSSSGNVRYYGEPQVTTHLSSVGRVIPMGNR
jgi:hypothetical protein